MILQEKQAFTLVTSTNWGMQKMVRRGSRKLIPFWPAHPMAQPAIRTKRKTITHQQEEHNCIQRLHITSSTGAPPPWPHTDSRDWDKKFREASWFGDFDRSCRAYSVHSSAGKQNEDHHTFEQRASTCCLSLAALSNLKLFNWYHCQTCTTNVNLERKRLSEQWSLIAKWSWI